jgi:hypothetical protein
MNPDRSTASPRAAGKEARGAASAPFAAKAPLVEFTVPRLQVCLHSDIDMGSAQPPKREAPQELSCQDLSCHPF